METQGIEQAVILAGGLGTRLRQVLADRPKAMAPFEGRPFLEYQLRALQAGGVRELVLCVGYLAETISGHFGDGADWGLRVRYSVEPAPLGTGGALKLAEPLLADTFLLLNGDTFLTCDLGALERHHREHRADMTLAVATETDAARYGSVAVGPDGRVTGFREKASDGRAGYVNAGLAVLSRALLADLPAGGPLSLEREALAGWVATRRVYAFPVAGGFVDIGTPEGYEQFARLVAAEPAVRLGTGARQECKPA